MYIIHIRNDTGCWSATMGKFGQGLTILSLRKCLMSHMTIIITWGSISQRLNDMASHVIIGGTTYAQQVVVPIHCKIRTINLHNATVGGLQHLVFPYETKWKAFRTLLIYPCHEWDPMPHPHKSQRWMTYCDPKLRIWNEEWAFRDSNHISTMW